ncbi:MAG: hypothetical protein ABI132_05285 [Rhodanobacteraceae bacterium]
MIHDNNVICSQIIIDRVSVVIDYVKEEDQVKVLQAFTSLAKSEYYARPGRKFRYKQSLKLYAGSELDTTILVEAQPRSPYVSFFRLEYNPAKIDPVNFRWIIEALLPGGWTDFVNCAVCTRIDLAVDITGIKVDELITYWPGMRRSRQFFSSGKTLENSNELPTLQTYEIGAYGGVRHVTIYDRNEQIRRENKKLIVKVPVPTQPVTRIEFRIRPKAGWVEVAGIQNLFAELQVGEFASLPSLVDDEKFRLFIALCQAQGVHNALLILTESTRKSYKKRLQQTAPQWWQPAKIWDGLEHALAVVLTS